MSTLFAPPQEFRQGLSWFLLVVYLAVATVPQILMQEPTGPHATTWAWWPAACVTCVLLVCAMTAYGQPPLWTRGLLVIVGVLSYFAITWPANKFAIDHWMPIENLPPVHARNQWAILRSISGIPQILFALHLTRLMARKPPAG